MNDITGSLHRSIANPRRITLANPQAADSGTSPRSEAGGAGDAGGLQILADDGAVCVDGVCALPE